MRTLGSSRTQTILESRQSPSRSVRVFISSTYRDMHAERERLIKHVFPQLRSFCERRRVTLSEVDLRWGIPQEEIDAGRLLPTCLAEVENCRPFFVCLLGDRYGEMITQIPDELLKSEPWLKDHSRKSITELEVLHGALNREAGSVNAFFYMRSSGRSETSSNVPADVGLDEAESRSKLEDLKKRILGSGFPVREYATPAQLEMILLDDLQAVFERIFPEEFLPSPREQGAAAHDAFVENRSRIYVGLQRHFDQLDKYVASRQSPLMLTGATGVGKSSLMANWVRRRLGYQTANQPLASISDRALGKFRDFVGSVLPVEGAPVSHLIAHFTEASPESADLAAMLRRLMEDMRERFKLQLDIPPRTQSLPAAFANYLQAVAARGTLILILDGIDKLSDYEQISKLSWLPAVVPGNIRLIVTATNGVLVDEFGKRRWPVMEIKPLRSAQRKAFVKDYLAQYSKQLDHEPLQRVTSAESTANPLYLRAVLEELRLFGRHGEELASHVDYLIAAPNTDELFERILARLEEDYCSPDPYRPEMVRNTMRLIWAAHEGLSESELADLLGTADGPLPSALWSPFYLAVKESFLNHSGLFSFFHDDFRRAVERRYLPDDAEKRAAHRELADYFSGSDAVHRRIVELPWHLAANSAWSELFALLAVPEFLSAAWPTCQFDVKAYWARIETSSPLRMVNAYAPVIAAPADYKDCLQAVCILLSDAGYVAEALGLSTYLG